MAVSDALLNTSVSLDRNDVARLRAIAQKEHRTLSQQLRHIVRKHIELVDADERLDAARAA